MSDPRLNSIHLESFRREEFRRAREYLLQARGSETLNAESLEAPSLLSGTIIQNLDNPIPNDVKYFVQDQDYVYPLKMGLNTIGRLPDNDIVINDAHVSRRHCAIIVHSREVCEVHDVASKNGTFINGAKLEGPTRLQHGDEIRMCDHSITFGTRPNASPSAMQPTIAPTS